MSHTSAGCGINGMDLVGCISSLDIPQAKRGPSPQDLILLEGVRFIAWRLRHLSLGKCRQGSRQFWECRMRLGYDPAPRLTLKRPCVTLVRMVERRTNTVVNFILDLNKKFGSSHLIRTIRVRLSSCRTFVITIGLIQLFSYHQHLTYKHCEILSTCVNSKQYRMPFPNFWNSELTHGAAFLIDSAKHNKPEANKVHAQS